MTRAAALDGLATALARFDRAAHDPRALARAAAAWAIRARAEHASIASFDRFALGLLAVGAPPELLEAAHEAALDEILHARLGFALASAYGAAPVGPGALPIEQALEAVGSLEALCLSTIAEGCVGETLSAIEAREAADLATEPTARETLARIADDEARHAELAWAFVRWALGADPRLVAAARSRFADALAHAGEPPRGAASGADDLAADDLAAYGFLPPARLAAVRRRALDEVLAPAAAALLDGAPGAR